MMTYLKRIATERFTNVSCDFYINQKDEIFIAREQIGNALEYVNPSKAINKIHSRHKDRLDPLCLKITGSKHSIEKECDKSSETTYYSEKGVIEICRWSSMPKASHFMDWFCDTVKTYHAKTNTFQMNQEIFKYMQSMEDKINRLQSTISQMENTLLTQQAINNVIADKGKIDYFPQWKKKWDLKFRLIQEYFGITRKQVFYKIYQVMERVQVGLDLNYEREKYCFEHQIEECYTINVVAYMPELRKLFEQVTDQIIRQYHLEEKCVNQKE